MAALQQARGLLLKGRMELKFASGLRTFSSTQRDRSGHMHSCFNRPVMKNSTFTKTCHVPSALLGAERSPSATVMAHSPSTKYYSSSPSGSDVATRNPTAPNQAHEQLAYSTPFNPELVEKLLKDMEGDMPLPEMPDPFAKDYPRCFLCTHNVQLDHKNIRLLSQFVSPHTGRIYGRAVTGLCIPMQKRVAQLIIRARKSGFMPVILKDSKYLNDPVPYKPMSKRT